MTIIVVGNTKVLTPAANVTANVGNVSTRTTTFHVTNASSSVYAYVGIFNTYEAALAMDHPSAGTDAGGTLLTPNESMTITGNFGTDANLATVYVSAITNSGSTSVFFTPVAAGSSG